MALKSSPAYSSWMKGSELGETASTLRVLDNGSNMARFNDERLWVEFILTRQLPRGPIWKTTLINPIVRGLHSEWVYRALEAAVDGIVDFKLEESGEETRHLMRIRNMRNVGFDRKWHVRGTGENFEVTLEK
jgi:KaiC/GvpD/RAD55 family RecA-like ATPase